MSIAVSVWIGEAEYVYDIPTTGDEVYAALVITKLGPADLLGLDADEALVCIQ